MLPRLVHFRTGAGTGSICRCTSCNKQGTATKTLRTCARMSATTGAGNGANADDPMNVMGQEADNEETDDVDIDDVETEPESGSEEEEEEEEAREEYTGPCEGCRFEWLTGQKHGSQLPHMEPGGCMHADTQETEE